MSARTLNHVKPIHLSPKPMLLRLSPVCHAIALMLAAGATINAQGATNLANIGVQMSAARNAAAAGGGVNLGVGMSPQQAFQASQPSIRNLAHAAQGIAQQLAAQQAAAAAAAGSSNVPNGLVAGGLQVAPGATSNSPLWLNANLPTESPGANGQTNVNIQQTGPDAILTWQTMNVGKQTALNFDQSAGTQTNGTNNWVVLNRIEDPSGAPSQIFGSVTAQGTVLVINRNGILFGAGSQVNVHSLVASSLDLLSMNDDLTQTSADIQASNAQLIQSGLFGTPPASVQNANEVLGLGNTVQVSSASQYQAPGDITIEPGASITTHINGTASDGGFVLIAAPNVTNGGTITTTNGQAILAAGVGVSFVASTSNVLTPELTGQLQVTASDGSTVDVTPAGTVINTGLIQADKGYINLLGSNVIQNGVVGVTTGVSFPGAITISTVDEALAVNPSGSPYTAPDQFGNITALGADQVSTPAQRRAGLLSFGPGSVTTDLPEEDGETTTSDPTSTFTPGSITLTAGSVWFQGGSLIEAPGSTVSVAALMTNAPAGDTGVQGRIYLDTGATIDVSGLSNVELPIADTLVTIPLIGANELADSPLLRDGFLNGLKNAVVDSTLTGTNSDGSQWVGSPILNLAGYVNLIPRQIDQLLINGGSITLAGSQVMTADGSSLNLNGGYIHYDGGIVSTTRLLDANGAIVPIGQASPFDTFVGIAGEFIENHPRWGVTNTWDNPLLSGGAYEPDYIVGGNAGTLNIFASQALVLDGSITAQAFPGERQVQDAAQPNGGTFALGVNSDLTTVNGTSSSGFSGEPGSVILQNTAPQLSDLQPGFTANTPLDTAALNALGSGNPNNLNAWQTVPVNTLNSGGFSNVSITEDGVTGKGIVVAQGTALTVQPGGSITLNAPAGASINVLGSLVAPDGNISIGLNGTAAFSGIPNNIVVGPDATISVAGLWVNQDTQAAGAGNTSGSEYINGGSITLSIDATSAAPPGGTATDTTGSILLQPGSVLDVSSGGELQQNGQLLMSNGIPEGNGGSISLLTYQGGYGGTQAKLPDAVPTAGQIEMNGTIRSAGFAGGGTLTLQALGFQIGGDASTAPAGDLVLPTDFFANQGFGNYVLNAMYGADVAPDTTVRLTQQNLIPNASALQGAATGANIETDGLATLGTLDPYHRQATSLVMTGGAYLEWSTQNGTPLPLAYSLPGDVTVGQGASIIADAGASVGLGSATQVTVLGSIVAPGGSITLSADTQNEYGFAVTGQSTVNNGFTTQSQSVWLGADALLDVAGIAIADPLAAPALIGHSVSVPDTGKVLPGGTVVLSDDRGYVVAQPGATIDVSGTSANFDELQANGGYASQPVWSDAGSITLGAASGLYFNGTIKAQGGAAQAQGGTLTILAEQGSATSTQPGGASAMTPGAQALIVQQAATAAPVALAPGDSFGGTPSGMIVFSADTLNGSGISTLVLGAPPPGGKYFSVPVPVAFAGDVDLNLADAVIISAAQIVALPAGSMSVPALSAGVNVIGAPTVTINAPYVALVGPTVAGSVTLPSPDDSLADGTLDINASFIDIENQVALANFGQANFTSSGDIRLSSTNATSTLLPGYLFTAGNMTFTAADVYPASGTTFILDAVGPTDPVSGGLVPTTITFLPNGTSGVPLSAGGSLLVDATNIVQAGTVRAPSGSLIFGVGDTGNTATQTQFDNLPLTNTQSVTLANGSVTSVSDDDTVIPYGTTVDGTEWQYNPTTGSVPDLTAPPSKFVSVNGSDVSLNAGATIDLSGGGDLQAEEWVPGTGGSRDLLSQYNISFATNPSGTAVPVNPGGANVYAVVPGYHAPVAAYDPVFAQVTQPSTAGNGSATTTTASMGVGQAGMNGMVGQAVYLQGVPGLPNGVYTLLPAKYATLPGAFRVVAEPTSGAFAPNAAGVLPDGSVVVAGYTANALTGSRSATPTLFEVQSGSVWQQYSQYTLTSANSFFPALAASAGNVTPQLPMDAGQLVIAAIKGLTLGATLNAAPANGGAPAEVDIASQDIQIVGNGEAALPGYLQIDAGQLDALGAGSLLIGGTRTQTTSGITINALANSVVVSNDAADPLTGPEIILVTKTDPTGTDPNAAKGLQVDPGSVIEALGSYPVAKDQPITIGQNANSTTGAAAISGDGALLSVTNGGDSIVTRLDTTGTGLLTVGAAATLTGGQALTLDSSGNLTFDPSATLSGNTIAVDGSAITFTNQTGAGAAALPGFVAGPNQLAQLANAQNVILRSAGAMNFDGDIDVTFGNNVDLSAGSFSSDGGAVTINAPQVTFTNELGAPVPAGTAGSGTLSVNANEIDFGTGDKTVNGFGSATFNATGGIVGQDTGTFDFGALPVTLNAPAYLADTSSDTTIKTTGTLNLNNASGTALPLSPLGGALSFIGGTVNDNGATIEAPAGNVSLEATSGDLRIGGDALVSSAGVSMQFFDVTLFAPAGAITLTADTGNVNVQAGSTLDFSGASGGGAAGSLSLSAPDQAVQLAGTIKGSAATGFLGGSFSLNTGGAVDLDNLASELASSGVNDAISVQTNAGNLTLSAGNTLTAHTVSLTADGGAGGQDPNNGNVQIFGTINANGNAGGEIDLYGKSGVDVEGSLLARACAAGNACDDSALNASQRGGTVNIGTAGTPNTVGGVVQLDPTYGYEEVSSANSGTITLGADALIDVSGGTAGGLSGGTVNFRAPLLDLADNSGANVFIAPAFNPGKGIVGSRATTLEAYAVWSTDDPLTAGATKHFDGIVDPAGWYNDSVAGAGQPGMVAGTWTDQSGNPLPNPTADQLASYLQNDFFTPNSGATNTDHQTFYGYQSDGTTPGTLMGFVENFPIDPTVAARFANVQNFAVTPGIELDNPDAAINNGNISILSNWNLGAGTAPGQLAFRDLADGQAPIITFRAENNVQVKASLTDGFFQIANPTTRLTTIGVPIGSDYSTVYGEFNAVLPGSPYDYTLAHYAYYDPRITPPHKFDASADPGEVAQYEGQYNAYLQFFAQTLSGGGSFNTAVPALRWAQALDANSSVPGQPVLTVSAPTAAEESANPASYLIYLNDYETVFNALLAKAQINLPAAGVLPFLQPPPAALGQVIGTSTISVGSPTTDNSPSPVAVAGNEIPLLAASLNRGPSSTFRLVAGANMSSSNPLAVQAASMFSAGSGTGSVTLDGHFAFNDPDSGQILVPTMIRTGTGSIDISAANDVALFVPPNPLDPLAQIVPGVIYTAGTLAAGAPPMGADVTILPGPRGNGIVEPDILVTPTVNPDGGGDISIHAQHDITGAEDVTDTTGAITGRAGTNISQFWWQWMELGNPENASGQITQTSIDFGAFDQGIMSSGGNVSVSAGGNITDLAVSLPTTWYLSNNNTSVNTVGGGNLNVSAGGNILSGDYFVANGTGTITAGGRIGADGLTYTVYGQNVQSNVPVGPVSTLLATQNGILDVSARQGADIGGVFNPSYIEGAIEGYAVAGNTPQADSQGYSATSAVNVVSTTGDVDLGSFGSAPVANGGQSVLAMLGIGSTTAQEQAAQILPATVNLAALSGGITVSMPGDLYPSATGQLSLIANGSINLSDGNASLDSPPVLGMIDADPAKMPSPKDPIDVNDSSGSGSGFLFGGVNGAATLLHDASALHANDTQPARIYSLNGSIVDGAISEGQYNHLLTVDLDKPAQIYAGDDILNLAFVGQNLREDDVTRIVAGHNIDDAPITSLLLTGEITFVVPSLQLAGPGTFDIEAGGNIGPLTSSANVATVTTLTGANTGIDAIGNADNPFLPHESANVQVLFGVAPGIDDQAFIANYINPASTPAGVPSTTPALIAFMQQYDVGQLENVDTGLAAQKAAAVAQVGTLTADQAWSQFQALPAYVQQIFVQQVLFSVLTDVGNDFHNSSSPFAGQYARGYQAINTLFPASLGYTANNLSGGANGANQLVTTGNLDIRSTTIQTQQGGDVSILGPGGQALVGSTSAPPEIIKNGLVVSGPNTMGILTLEQGNIDIFTDQSLLLAQSRVFTEQGGSMTIWSSNGDINAGQGSKTLADIPPPQYVCDVNHYCTLDAKGEVTGAGIGTLQTIPGAATGDINLLAPRGKVDAGAAGIRVSGNLNIAALQVLNADNIQVQGKATGVPVVAAVDTGALTAAGSAASAATQMAQTLVRNNAQGVTQRHWIITVQVEGFGESSDDSGDDTKKKRKSLPSAYNPSESVAVLGFGGVGQTQRTYLTKEEQSKAAGL